MLPHRYLPSSSDAFLNPESCLSALVCIALSCALKTVSKELTRHDTPPPPPPPPPSQMKEAARRKKAEEAAARERAAEEAAAAAAAAEQEAAGRIQTHTAAVKARAERLGPEPAGVSTLVLCSAPP